jgi:5-methylthioadenosine/S-adenosylhomocysteine deaminase
MLCKTNLLYTTGFLSRAGPGGLAKTLFCVENSRCFILTWTCHLKRFLKRSLVLACKADIVIRNAVVITVNDDFEIIENGQVAVKDGRIASVASAGAIRHYQAKQVIDARGGLVMPGLVNTHTHLPMSLFRGLADDLPLQSWLNDYIFPAEAAHINPENVYAGSLLSCAEMLLSGTTTCCDGYFYENYVAEAVAQAGIRGVLGQGVIDFPAPGSPDPAKNIKTALDFIRQWAGRNPRITPSVFCHSPYTCSFETLKKARRAADEAGLLFQIHLAETRNEKCMSDTSGHGSVTAWLADKGILKEKTLASHCVWTSDDDIEIIRDKGAAVSHNPESNMKLASGVAPVPAMIDAGICVGLGTDGCASNNNLDMFEAMGFAAKLHKAASLNPTVMDAKTVVRMATIEGARALGLDHVIGSVEKGKAADLIVINTRRPGLCPMYHPQSHLVYAVCGADVSDVLVDGKILVRDGVLESIDCEDLIKRVNMIHSEIARMGRKAE